MSQIFLPFLSSRSLPGLLGLGSLLVVALAPFATQSSPVLVRTGTGACLAPCDDEIPFKIARIYWEYNSSANDLGVHVLLDAEDWKRVRIEKPNEQTLFEVKGRGPYQELGMTELFFEGAEPSLDEVPLQTLLAKFPEGEYGFEGRSVTNEEIESDVPFSHAIPAGPVIHTTVSGNSGLTVHWTLVTSTPPGFPVRPIVIRGYQVIVGAFQVTLPPTATSVTVPPEFVGSLAPGTYDYEVLAVDQSGNQTITEGTFVK